MAHFRATIVGNRGEASRLGTKNSGLHATVNGWHLGVDVSMVFNGITDMVTIRLTAGSNRNGRDVVLGQYTREQFDKLAREAVGV